MKSSNTRPPASRGSMLFFTASILGVSVVAWPHLRRHAPTAVPAASAMPQAARAPSSGARPAGGPLRAPPALLLSSPAAPSARHGMTLEHGPSGHTATLRRDYRVGDVDVRDLVLRDVEIDAGGLRLARSRDGRHRSTGVMQSLPIQTDAAFNAVGAQWAEKRPAGTSVLVEIATSSDGVSFTAWRVSQPDPHGEAAPERADGTPNPSYGDVIGTLVGRTDDLAGWVRYRITLETKDARVSPVVERVALTYMDSTDAATAGSREPEPMRE